MVSIRLYKAGVFVIEQKIERDKGEQGLIAKPDIGNWHRKEDVITLIMNHDTMEIQQAGDLWKVENSFSCYEEHEDLRIEDMEFKKTFCSKRLSLILTTELSES